MTIAAGFCVREGIVMCADTMYTAAMKIHGEKLVFSYEGDCSWVFALACQNEAYAKMAIDDCQDAIRACPVARRDSLGVKNALRAAIKKVNEEYIDKRPVEERDSARFELLIAIKTRDCDPVLYSTSGAALMEVNFYECIGTGSYLGHYLIRPAYNQANSINNTVLIAAQALAAAKSYDAGCGGGSVFVVLNRDGSLTPLVHYDFREMEDYIARYEKASREFLLLLGNLRSDEAEFGESLARFGDVLRSIRTSWKQQATGFESIVKTLEFQRLEERD